MWVSCLGTRALGCGAGSTLTTWLNPAEEEILRPPPELSQPPVFWAETLKILELAGVPLPPPPLDGGMTLINPEAGDLQTSQRHAKCWLVLPH